MFERWPDFPESPLGHAERSSSDVSILPFCGFLGEGRAEVGQKE
jgi:hypothetical protein